MKYLYNFIAFLMLTLPVFWIENYNFTNPIFWTVVGSIFLSRSLGYWEGLNEEDGYNANTKI